jgi:predicted dinucleotide-binding enzyme
LARTVGIIGSGTIGRYVAENAARAGFRVVLSNRGGERALADAVSTIGDGAVTGTVEHAAGADITVLAIPWEAVHSTLGALPSWSGRIVVDATNAVKRHEPPVIEYHDFGERTSSEVVAELAADARVVKAFNTLPFPMLSAPPWRSSGRRVLFLCGDDVDAKNAVASLVDTTGYVPFDLGDLATGSRMQQAGAPLAGVDLIISEPYAKTLSQIVSYTPN